MKLNGRGKTCPGAMHEGCPWRDVVYIEEGTPGPQGGRAWCLTLSCGHHAFRPIPHPDPERALAHAKWRQKCLRGAPKRVRCLYCKEQDGVTP